ncbi:MAG TPA: cytochrome c3 family protein [Bryobacteraceae bacterium]|jgi:hypothetical protein|nr:cytochrome c3 family protein [Bryobacteraceae bacterium]
MALVFPKSTDKFVRLGGAVLALLVLSGGGAVAYFSYPDVLNTGYTPTQPVPYSHKLHVGQIGMDCYYCHNTVYKAAWAAVPPTETCMNCHVRVKNQSPRLEKVRESYATGKPIEWVKVHDLPDYVYFNHQAHVTAGVSCVSCHGRIDQMIEVKQMQPLTMGWCLECHRNPAPNIRPPELVTKLDWVPDRDPAEIGRELIKEKGIHPPQQCSACHR